MQLAQDRLGKKHLYFDSSKYGQLAIVGNGERKETNLVEVQNGNAQTLILLLQSAHQSGRSIAVSGRDPKRTARILMQAIDKLKEEDLKGLEILYIGNIKYFTLLKKYLANRKIQLIFENTPPTSK
ncbi:MAG: hypothetical protein Q9M92_03035 [Enterobacterales bacterium]|nr:hypothetical protein [Enterobacterales bacterium]